MGQRKCTTLDHRVKREICKHKQANPDMTNRELQVWVEEKFDAKVHEVTIGRVLKRSSALLSNVTGNEVKRAKNPQCPAVEEALHAWFLSAQEAKLTTRDDILIEKARQLFDGLVKENPEMKECKFSNGWLYGFKKRHNIQMRVIHGEGDSVELPQDTWDKFAALKATLSDFEASPNSKFIQRRLVCALIDNCIALKLALAK
ncbi:unnamed protein product [Calypogeia fissa]